MTIDDDHDRPLTQAEKRKLAARKASEKRKQLRAQVGAASSPLGAVATAAAAAPAPEAYEVINYQDTPHAREQRRKLAALKASQRRKQARQTGELDYTPMAPALPDATA